MNLPDNLRAGDSVELSGRALSLPDASAARLAAAIERGDQLPISLAGRIIGSAGPTTTARMARFLRALLSAGVIGVIGKGELHGDDMAAFTQHGAVYLAAIGGLGALLSKHITAASVVAYGELGPEALYALELERFPAVVIIAAEAGTSTKNRAHVGEGILPPEGGSHDEGEWALSLHLYAVEVYA